MPLPGSRALTASLFLLGAGSLVAVLGWLPEFLRITRFSGEPAILALTIAGPILVLVLGSALRSSSRTGLPAGRGLVVVCIVAASLALPATLLGGASAAAVGAFGDALLLLASMLSLLLLGAGLILAIVGAARLPKS